MLEEYQNQIKTALAADRVSQDETGVIMENLKKFMKATPYLLDR
jgi:hypothetical protein